MIERRGAFGMIVSLNFERFPRMLEAYTRCVMARNEATTRTYGGGLLRWQVEISSQLLLRDLSAEIPAITLAKACGLSRSYFAKAFKISMGAPPHRWVVRERIRRSVYMLERAEDSISAIALDCGFADQSHFTRAFRGAMGVSPAAWRRRRLAGMPVAHTSPVACDDYARPSI